MTVGTVATTDDRVIGDAQLQPAHQRDFGPYMALSCSGRWPFLDGPGWFWEGPGAPESVAIAYPFDEAAAREWIERQVDSGPRDTKAQSRQIGAQWHGPKLSALDKPTLVMRGDADPIVRTRGGRVTAKRIHGASYVELAGVGHDLPQQLWSRVATDVRRNANRAEGGTA